MLIKRTHLPSEVGGKTEGKLHLLSALCQPDRGWTVTNTIHQIPIENLFCWGRGWDGGVTSFILKVREQRVGKVETDTSPGYKFRLVVTKVHGVRISQISILSLCKRKKMLWTN